MGKIQPPLFLKAIRISESYSKNTPKLMDEIIKRETKT
jgi:hypothetical protein